MGQDEDQTLWGHGDGAREPDFNLESNRKPPESFKAECNVIGSVLKRSHSCRERVWTEGPPSGNADIRGGGKSTQ